MLLFRMIIFIMNKQCLHLHHRNQIKKDKMTTINLGNIGSKEQAEKLVKKLEGKTYMNFIVQYGICMNNYPVTVSTERAETSKKELRKMVTFYLAINL